MIRRTQRPSPSARRRNHKPVDRASLSNLLQMHIKERAQRLAKAPAPARNPGDEKQYVTFKIQNSTYALPTTVIRETFRTSTISCVPGAPDVLVGLVNFRGAPLPVVDLSRLLGLGPTTAHAIQWIIVLGQEPGPFGILADSVLTIDTLPEEQTQASDLSIPVTARALVKSVSSAAVVVLDATSLMCHPSLQFGSRL